MAAAAMIALPTTAFAAAPGEADVKLPSIAESRASEAAPAVLDADQVSGYRQVFASIHAGAWSDAQIALDAMKPGPLHPIALAELYTAKGSPKVALQPLLTLLGQAPELPEADQLAGLAKLRGATDDMLPTLPEARKLSWIAGAPIRIRLHSTGSDAVAAQLETGMRQFIKDDNGAAAEALLEETQGLTPEAQTEWQARVAWIYYLAGDDGNARLMAAKSANDPGDWGVQANWTIGLAAWRQHDSATAATAFLTVASRATDVDLRAAGLYWASRANMANGRPDLIQTELTSASQYTETFYGLLARQALGLSAPVVAARADATDAWKQLARLPNAQVAAGLVQIGEAELADDVLRHQAAIGDAGDYHALVHLAGDLNLPETEIWLSHNGPAGAEPSVAARYPTPNWTPDGGWRVDKALVFAHTLQESSFRRDVVSAAGAYGLMQIRPAAATDIARARGEADRTYDRASLSHPSTNIEIGQSYLEQLRDQPCTGGLLPKVIAAYNAGPLPVQAWNMVAKNNADPLLYIESIPYWETRGYVVTVLRNYWMYEGEEGKKSASRAALAQDLWPRFPGLPGATAVRMTPPAANRTLASAD
ncbi:lytic transglycosylase domain-containing protein [Sphingomonas koreensis]|nr:lytic transglycosylase domain-containing protein [Sphingomonas koreensis]